MNNPTRQTKQDDLAAMRLREVLQRRLVPSALICEKLEQLQEFIGQLEQTPHGREELRDRRARFGDCRRDAGETASQFYGKLRAWLDRDVERPLAGAAVRSS